MAQLKAARAAAAPDIVGSGAKPIGLASGACMNGISASSVPADGRARRPPLVVMGHRGKGMNALASPDARLRGDVRENTIRSFNDAARCHPGVHYVEFDVQVTKDGCPVIFHDIFIYTEEQDGEVSGKRVTDLRLDEFLSYGPQKGHGNKAGKKPLLRKLKEDGRVVRWDAMPSDDALCTLREAFERVDRRVGFNVELKFDDDAAYAEEELAGTLQAVLQVVFEHADDGRPVIFSTFQPDAAVLMRRLQHAYPVYFLTKGGTEVFADARRNSLDAAVRLCLAAGLQGIVSEVRAVLRHPSAVAQIKEVARLSLLTYGQLNNVPEVVYAQHLIGVDGVIVDLVQEIAEAVAAFTVTEAAPRQLGSSEERAKDDDDESNKLEKNKTAPVPGAPTFTQRDVSFLLNRIPELVQ